MASAAERLKTEVGEPVTQARRIVDRDGPAHPAFGLANGVPTTTILDWCHVEHDGEKFAVCPGCSEPGALLCRNGGVKCLHDRCKHAGKNHPGFRTNVEIVRAHEHLTPLNAAIWICERADIAIPKTSRDDDDREYTDDDAPDAPPKVGDEPDTPPRSVASFTKITTPEIFAPLPPIRYLIRPLDICPGPPGLIAGYGFSAKTMATQSACVSIAADRRVWGAFEARPGRVLHIDYEQGRRLTLERYQRLCAAEMLTPDDLADRLVVVALPSIYLDHPGAESVFMRECEGYDLVVVDSLRAAAPSIEENASDVRRVLDMLARVSERTGCTPIVIHHARKPSVEKSGGARMAIRGSGAIFDACSSVLVFEGEKGQPTRVIHEKARTSGVTTDDFLLDVEDVEIDGNPRGGVRVVATAIRPEDRATAFAGLMEKVVEELRSVPAGSKTALANRIGGRRQDIFAAIDELVMKGTIVVDGKVHRLG